MKNKYLLFSLISILGSLFFFFGLTEAVLHLMVRPADHAYGEIFSRKLPPFDLVPWSQIRTEKEQLERRKQWANELVVDGIKITQGDLGAVMIEDPLLGHIPEPNHISPNGWYQTNSLGARSRKEFIYEVPEGKRRILIYGDSFAAGMRLPQEQTWVSLWEQSDENLEAVNFGVGGYGMGLAYLRFLQTKDLLEYDDVFLMIVPESDLFRDINTIRYLGKRWDSYRVQSRFVLENGKLKLIPSPYKNIAEMERANANGLSDKLRKHLELYEPYYFSPLYKEIPVFGKSIFFKLLLIGLKENRRNNLRRTMMYPESEAMKINMKIFEAMNLEAAKFHLIVLPRTSSVRRYQKRRAFRKDWDRMIAAFESGDYLVWNLMEEMKEVPYKQLDPAYDKTHYGPKAVKLISKYLNKRYREE